MKPVPIVLGAVVVALSLVVAVVLYGRYGPGEVRSGLLSFEVVSDSTVRIRFEVVKDPAQTAVCTVRARDREGTEAGVALVRVEPAAEGRTRVSYDLATRLRATSGELIGCSPAS